MVFSRVTAKLESLVEMNRLSVATVILSASRGTSTPALDASKVRTHMMPISGTSSP
jgi:hypothetical protein